MAAPPKIVSGGQSGVDRAALDAALALGAPCGGWCPKGRRAEDGPLDGRYPLKETPGSDYSERTEWNVRDSDGTLIFTWGPPEGGTALTVQLAARHKKPVFIWDFEQAPEREALSKWISEEEIQTLNVAGPRASKQPQAYEIVKGFVSRLLSGE